MARLIDAEELKKAFVGNRYGTKAIEYYIDNAPTVDAEPVVRCKDCTWCKPINNEVRGFYKNCFRHEIAVYDDGFCAWGERREDEAD